MMPNALTAAQNPGGQPSPAEEAAALCHQLTEKMPPTERTAGRIDERFDRVREEVAKRLDLFVKDNHGKLDRLYGFAQAYPRLAKRLADLFDRFDRLEGDAFDLSLRDDVKRLRLDIGEASWPIRVDILNPYFKTVTVVDPLRDEAKRIHDDLAKLGDLAGRLWDGLRLSVRRERWLDRLRAMAASGTGADQLREMNRRADRLERLSDDVVDAVIAEAAR